MFVSGAPEEEVEEEEDDEEEEEVTIKIDNAHHNWFLYSGHQSTTITIITGAMCDKKEEEVV